MKRQELEQLARKNYFNRHALTEDDFQEDLLRIKHLKKLLTRYKEGELRERLIINHIVILFNVFESAFVQFLLSHEFQKEDYVTINTFLVFLNRSLDFVYINPELLEHLRDNIGR